MSSLRRTALLVLALLTFVTGPAIAASAPALAADPVGTLTIHLRDAAGHPIPNNHLFVGPTTMQWGYQPWTDAQGNAVIQVKPADYQAWSSDPYPAGPTQPVTVTDGGAAEITITTTKNAYEYWPTPGISGEAQVGLPLTGHRGGWVDMGADVTWQWNRGGTAIPGATASSYTPTFEDQSLPITLSVTGPVNGVPTTRTSPPMSIAPATKGRVAGQIRFAGTDEPVGNVWVVVCVPGPGTWGCLDGTPQGVNTDAEGRIERILAPGSYKVWIRGNNAGATEEWWTASGGTPDHNLAEVVTVTAGQTTDLGTIELQRLGHVTVSATDDQGSPVNDADFYLMGDWRGYQGHPPNNGTFDATGVEPGTYSLTVEPSEASGLRPTTISVDVTPGADLDLDVVLYAHSFTGTPTASLSGTAKVGQPLTASTSDWVEQPETTAYRWFRDGDRITGATGATYVPVAGDLGAAVSVEVTGDSVGFEPRTVTSDAVTVAAGTFVATKPTVTGRTVVGRRLTAKVTGWTPQPTLTYQWLRDGKVVKGATGRVYLLTRKDRGSRISVRVTGTAAGYTTVTKRSGSTGRIS